MKLTISIDIRIDADFIPLVVAASEIAMALLGV